MTGPPLSTAGWNVHLTTGSGPTATVISGSGSSYGLSNRVGSPTNLDNVASASTTTSTPTGFLFVNTSSSSTGSAFLVWTDEFSIDLDYYYGLSFRFWMGNASTAAKVRLAVRVDTGSGSEWFATDSTASSAAVTSPNLFATAAEEKVFAFSAIGSTWRPIENAEASPTTGRTLSLPPSLNYSLPVGDITAFGWFIDPAGGGVVRLDTLEISAIPEPSAIGALAGLGVIGFAAARRRRRA